MSFPTNLDNIPQPGSGDITTSPSHAGTHDLEITAIQAVEAKVGIGASTPVASTLLRGTGTGTSAYAQANLTTDVTGTLPVANGGSGVTSSTGTGNVVLSGTPTINAPTITGTMAASVINASSNATIGGTLGVTGATTLSGLLTVPTGIAASAFALNMKSATNTGTTIITGEQDLAAQGLTLSFMVASNCNALVTVSLGISSSQDFEFRPEIRLGGSIVQTLSPVATNSNNSATRACVRGFTYVVALTTGVNVLSAGVFVSAASGLSMAVGGGTISALVLGQVTA
jgi:hypothetical protein